MVIDSYRDGGTVWIQTEKLELYIDAQIGTNNKGAIYDKYPGEEDSHTINDLAILHDAKQILEQAKVEAKYYTSTIILGLDWVNK